MKSLTPLQEKYFLTGLKQSNKDAFSLLFTTYYTDLVLFGGNFVQNKTIAEDIVQNVFLKLWNDRSNLEIETSFKSYLLKAVRNSCLDELRHQEIVRDYHCHAAHSAILDDYDTENYILYSDLYTRLEEALKKLPPKIREAFEMNRFEGLKYQEIAQRLEVSQRTVEVRIGKALELLRIYLKEFFILVLYFLFY
ncbi:RNA polymerase sigma-70 factor [Parabacteroides pacaensis]|uniref:RNA polymerase sigma-70 factor n=1 Tax=Parabacteroides pacaensis TaxID=2086575 RepID=UPI000D0F428A